MRVRRSSPRHDRRPAARLGLGWVLLLPILVAAACGSATPSPTVRPEFAWSRATIDLPADVVEVAPGSSGGMICSPCHAEQASLMTGITTTADGLLAVGHQLPPSTAVAYRSADGRTWDAEPGFTPGEDTVALATVADDARRIIVGRRGQAAAAWVRTADEAAWRAAPDQPSLRGTDGGGAAMQAAASWRGTFVAAGTRDTGTTATGAAIWTSGDGLAWDLVSSGPAFEDAVAYGIAASDTGLVVVGAAGRSGTGPAVAWVSDDGRTWTRIDSPSFAAGSMRAVARTPSGFVAAGLGIDDDRAMTWTSADGLAWAAQPTTTAFENAGRPIRMLAIAPAGDGLIAAGWKSDAGNGSGVVWVSPDGSTWDRRPDQVSMSGASLSGVLVAGELPVAVGTSGYPDNDQASAWFEGP